MVCRVVVFKVGTAIVECLAVGSPEGEHLELRGILLDVRDLVLYHVIGDEVALGVEHLNLIGIGDVEGLLRLVRGIDDNGQGGVPGRIDTGGEQRVVSHIDLPYLTVVGDDSAPQVLTGMKLHALRIVLLVAVTVDALSLRGCRAEHIVVDDALVVVLETALADGQFLVRYIRRRDETVADVGINRVVGDIDGEGLIAHPLAVVLREHLHADGLSFGFLLQ